MEKITSVKNQKVKQWKKMHSLKGRREAGKYLLEGEHLYEEAVKAGVKPLEVVITPAYLEKKEAEGTIFETGNLLIVSEEVMKSVSLTQTSQGIFCVMELPEASFPTQMEGKFIWLDSIQDPGNAGTIVRTADAAGFCGVVFGTGSVDPYNDKVLRSMQGSNFHIPIYQGNLELLLDECLRQEIPVYGTALDVNAVDYRKAAPAGSLTLILGNEGSGVSETLLKKTNQNLYIPIKGKAESLNVAVAAGILMYHFL